MKARIRKTGEIVEVICYGGNPSRRSEVLDYVNYIDSKGVEHTESNNLNYYWDFEPVEDEKAYDWCTFRNQAAIAAMQGIVSNPTLVNLVDESLNKDEQGATIALCVAYADELVAKLKEKQKDEPVNSKLIPKFSVGQRIRNRKGEMPAFIIDRIENDSYKGMNGESVSIAFQDEWEHCSSFKIIPKPKFHEGDWVVFDNKPESVYRIEKIENFQYTLRHILGGSMPLSFSSENMLRLWTLQDAKDGDILVFKTNIGDIIICKSPTDYDTGSYCRLVNNKFINKEGSGWDSTLLIPATKKQRSLLFQKMKESGYEWDSDKKELKKLKEPENYKNRKWSEEDERLRKELLDFCIECSQGKTVVNSREDFIRWTTWLKEVGDRKLA